MKPQNALLQVAQYKYFGDVAIEELLVPNFFPKSTR